MKSKEEILIWALNNRCKYESSKEMDYDTHLAIMDAMRVYANEQIGKYKELIEVQKNYIEWLKAKPSINDIAHLSYKLKINKLKTELKL